MIRSTGIFLAATRKRPTGEGPVPIMVRIWSLAIIAGGGTASAIAGSSGATRLTSTATTGGMGNPIVSTLETGTSITLSAFSIFVPIVGFILVLVVLLYIFKFYKKIKPSKP